MRNRVMFLLSLLSIAGVLSGCETMSGAGKPRPGVREAQACQRSLQNNPHQIPGFIIRACTNTGVWVVDRLDPDMGTPVAQYDFVNGDYSGPETGFSLVAVDSLDEDLIRSYRALRISLNRDLRKTL